jgi:hypothetical protein
MLLDELLSVGRAAEDLMRRRHVSGRIGVPADALIIGVTSLRSQVFPPDLLHFKRTGHTTVALVIDTSDLLPVATTGAEEAARTIWLAQREAGRRRLERGGIPTALVTPRGGASPAILTLRRRLDGSRRKIRAGGFTA